MDSSYSNPDYYTEYFFNSVLGEETFYSLYILHGTESYFSSVLLLDIRSFSLEKLKHFTNRISESLFTSQWGGSEIVPSKKWETEAQGRLQVRMELQGSLKYNTGLIIPCCPIAFSPLFGLFASCLANNLFSQYGFSLFRVNSRFYFTCAGNGDQAIKGRVWV